MNPLSYKTNFLPLELQSTRLHQIRWLCVIAAILAAAFLCGCLVIADQCADIHRELAVVQKELTQIESAYRTTVNIKKERAAVEDTCRQYTEIISQQRQWSEMLLNLNRIAPAGLRLVELEAGSQQENADSSDSADSADPGDQESHPSETTGTTETQEAQGAMTTKSQEAPGKRMIMKGCAAELSAVGIFLLELGKLPYFQTVSLDQVTTESEVLNFQITATLHEVK